MKILQIIPYFSPKFGGPIRSVTLLSQELAKRGHEVTIITSDLDFDPDFAESVKQHSVEILPFRTIANIGLFIYTPSMKVWLDQNISRYNIVHLHEYRSYQNSLVMKAANDNKIPTLLQARGSVLPFFKKIALKRLYDFVWGRDILVNASKIIALCEAEAAQYCAMGVPADKIVIIPNGIDISQFSKLPTKGNFRHKYNIRDDDIIVLFLGRLHKIKGIDLLIDAYAELVKENSDFTLVISGPDDDTMSGLKEQIKCLNLPKDPIFTGPLYDQDKLAAYADADVYVLPSRYETFPNTVLEAWACGLPVIVSTGCLIADVVGQAGSVCECTTKELKQAISQTINDDDKRIQNINAGLYLVSDHFSLESCVDRIVDVYNQTVALN